MATERVVLEYKRKISEGGKCTGEVVVRDAQNERIDGVEFEQVPFKDMLEAFGHFICKYPQAEGWYKRIDRPGFEEEPWLPQHVEAFRSDLQKVVNELSNPMGVEYKKNG